MARLWEGIVPRRATNEPGLMEYFAIRNEGAPDGLIRQAAWLFEYLSRAGQWIEQPELLKKVREWNVDPVDEAEAAAIAMRLGATSSAR